MFHRKAGFCASLLALGLLATGGAGWSQEIKHCGYGKRLVPTYRGSYSGLNDYDPNAPQFNAVCLPEAWEFMTGRWQGLRSGIGHWPFLVVIDDGFFTNQDSPVRPEIHPGYPDGSSQFPQGTAWGDTASSPALYGYHGTAVLSLLSSTANNAYLIAGICGKWDNLADGGLWGARFLPVRIGRGIVAPPTPSLLAQIFNQAVLPYPQARVVNLSKTLVDVSQPPGSDLENALLDANAQQVVVVTGAGNSLGTVKGTRWVRQFENVIVVGALNEKGTDLWIQSNTVGTATGDGVDLYAPGEDLTVVSSWSTTAQDSGTSYAAPFVAGVVAMMQNIDPSLDAWEVRDILVKTADPVMPSNGRTGVRRLNAYRAVRCVDVLQRWSTLGGPKTPPVRGWDCSLGSFGSASGSRVGW
jgi:subtilisin family serine protease